MPQFKDYTFLSCNGKTNIHVRRCDPDVTPRGVVQIAHGVAEHVGRYEGFMRFLAENGYVAVANDHLGHGQSLTDESELGWFAENGGWELVVGDMHKLHESLAEEFPGLPYFLLGHSMGSFLARTYIIRYRTGLSGVILSGTGQQSRAVVMAGKLIGGMEARKHGLKYKSKRLNDMAFGKYNAAFAPSRTLCDWLSRDEASVDNYVADPLCGYIPSAGLFLDMMTGVGYICNQRNVERMKKDLPVCFMSGDKDPVGENGRGVMRAYDSFLRAGMTDVTLKLYHDCRHEILNELNKADVYADILSWMDSKA